MIDLGDSYYDDGTWHWGGGLVISAYVPMTKRSEKIMKSALPYFIVSVGVILTLVGVQILMGKRP